MEKETVRRNIMQEKSSETIKSAEEQPDEEASVEYTHELRKKFFQTWKNKAKQIKG